jgi:hypothetical protein
MACASWNSRMSVRMLMLGNRVLVLSGRPVFGEVAWSSSHLAMAERS